MTGNIIIIWGTRKCYRFGILWKLSYSGPWIFRPAFWTHWMEGTKKAMQSEWSPKSFIQMYWTFTKRVLHRSLESRFGCNPSKESWIDKSKARSSLFSKCHRCLLCCSWKDIWWQRYKHFNGSHHKPSFASSDGHKTNCIKRLKIRQFCSQTKKKLGSIQVHAEMHHPCKNIILRSRNSGYIIACLWCPIPWIRYQHDSYIWELGNCPLHSNEKYSFQFIYCSYSVANEFYFPKVFWVFVPESWHLTMIHFFGLFLSLYLGASN